MVARGLLLRLEIGLHEFGLHWRLESEPESGRRAAPLTLGAGP